MHCAKFKGRYGGSWCEGEGRWKQDAAATKKKRLKTKAKRTVQTNLIILFKESSVEVAKLLFARLMTCLRRSNHPTTKSGPPLLLQAKS